MQTQNTPVHIKLWNRDFWQLATANLLMTMSVYMLLPAVPLFMQPYSTPVEIAASMGSYGLGLFMLGGFSSFLVQRYRRNQVCLFAILAMAVSLCGMYYMCGSSAASGGAWMFVVGRFVLGAFFGLAQLVLMGTLIIDNCESFWRTEANYSSAWFSRFALALGPLASLVTYRFLGFTGVLASSIVCCLLSALLIHVVKFPFRAPEDNVRMLTLDRFFLTRGKWLFVNLALVAAVVGQTIAFSYRPVFYVMMMSGFLMALLAQKFVFVQAELKSEVLTGLLLIAAALLMLQSGQETAAVYIAPAFIGLGTGITAARFQMFFIKLSRHCQRATSQSTYILAWESGLSLGLSVGYAFFAAAPHMAFVSSLSLTALSAAMYHFFTHTWYLENKNR